MIVRSPPDFEVPYSRKLQALDTRPQYEACPIFSRLPWETICRKDRAAGYVRGEAVG